MEMDIPWQLCRTIGPLLSQRIPWQGGDFYYPQEGKKLCSFKLYLFNLCATCKSDEQKEKEEVSVLTVHRITSHKLHGSHISIKISLTDQCLKFNVLEQI